MLTLSNNVIFVICAALFIGLIYLLTPILTPFLLGALLAYLINPLVKWMGKHHIPHLVSVILVFILLLFLFVLLLLTLFPILETQFVALMRVMPDILIWAQNTILPLFKEFVNVDTIRNTLSVSLPKGAAVFTTVLHSGQTILTGMINLLLTTVVTFYLLRDWDTVLNGIRSLLPQSIKPTVILLAQECNDVLSAFFRGQLLVMIALGIIYGLGLTLVGLRTGMLIGLLGGLFSIVPYVGSLFVLTFGLLTAFVQIGTWQACVGILVVFLIGQSIEGYVLTPYLVGERIGLHPVAVIFAILAGGTLFGFFGVLIALPTAAVILVLLRFLRRQYQ